MGGRAARDVRAAHHRAAAVDGRRLTGRAAQRAEVFESAVAVEECVVRTARRLGEAGHLPRVINREGSAGGTAEGTEIRERASRVEKCVIARGRSGEHPHSVAEVVNTECFAAGGAQRSQLCVPAAGVEDESTGELSSKTGDLSALVHSVARTRIAIGREGAQPSGSEEKCGRGTARGNTSRHLACIVQPPGLDGYVGRRRAGDGSDDIRRSRENTGSSY